MEPNPSKTPDIEPERLAAFLEGKLGVAEREEVLELLATSADQAAIVADAAAVLAEGRDVESSGRLPARWLVPLLLAASLAVVAGVSLWMGGRNRYVADPSGLIVAIGPEARELRDWKAELWPVTRGAAREGLSALSRATRVGVRMADLAFAVSVGDSSATLFAHDIAALIDGIPAGTPVSGMFRQVASAPNDAAMLDAAFDGAFTLIGDPAVGMSAFLEAARLATEARSFRFFESRPGRAGLESLRTIGADDGGTEAAVVLRLSGESPVNWPALDQSLRRLIELRASAAR